MKEFYRGKYNFAKVAKEFQLIEQETKTIFICKEPEAKEILDEIKTKERQKRECEKQDNIAYKFMVISLAN